MHERERGLYQPAGKAFEKSAVRDIIEQLVIGYDYNHIRAALKLRILGALEASLRGIHAAASVFKLRALLPKRQTDYREKGEIIAQKHPRYRGIEFAEHSALGAVYAFVELIVLYLELRLERLDIACHLFPPISLLSLEFILYQRGRESVNAL